LTDVDPITYGVPVRIIGTSNAVTTHITHDGGTTQPIATFSAGTIIEHCLLVVTEAINGTATVNIGIATNTDGMLPDASITKTLAAVNGEDEADLGDLLYATHKHVYYCAAATIVNATLGSLGTTTTGEADVIITYRAP
jgi:hypothetical protein